MHATDLCLFVKRLNRERAGGGEMVWSRKYKFRRSRLFVGRVWRNIRYPLCPAIVVLQIDHNNKKVDKYVKALTLSSDPFLVVVFFSSRVRSFLRSFVRSFVRRRCCSTEYTDTHERLERERKKEKIDGPVVWFLFISSLSLLSVRSWLSLERSAYGWKTVSNS